MYDRKVRDRCLLEGICLGDETMVDGWTLKCGRVSQ